MTQQEKQINYMGPFITMVFLFFIVGFLTTANTQFQGPLKETFLSEVGGLKNTFATLITFSWFLAYPVCGGVGSSWISKYGYKGTLMRGLLVMIVGLGLFFASSYFTVHFPEANWHAGNNVIPGGFLIFLLGSFVVGASATILQVVINPYLTACHVKGTQSIQRLAIGGSANSVGTTLAPYFVTGVVFGGLSMEDIQIDQLMVPFLALMAVISLIVLLLMKLSLPDIQGTRVEKGEKLEKKCMVLPSSDIGRGSYLLLCRSGSLYRGQYQSVRHRDGLCFSGTDGYALLGWYACGPPGGEQPEQNFSPRAVDGYYGIGRTTRPTGHSSE